MKKLLLNRLFITVSVIACVNFFAFKASAFSGIGAGTYADPYQITSAAQLLEAQNVLSASYKLMADIDLSTLISTSYPTTGWPGIGWNIAAGQYFSGNFDGNGHVISGIWIASSSYWNGLFRTVGGTVEIKNLGVIVASGKSITSSRYVGGIVGYAAAGSSLTISNCFVQGNITATDKTAGGLVGYSLGNTTLTNCYAGGGTITHGTSNDGSGGIMGTVSGATCVTTITNCYATNTLTTTSGTGGFPSGILGGAPTAGATTAISNSVAINPSITSSNTTSARIIGWCATAATLTNNFAYDGTLVSGVAVTTGTATNNNGLNQTLDQLTTQATYSTWDFNTVWTMGNGTYPFPVLKNMSNQPSTRPSYLPAVVTGVESANKLTTKVYYSSQSGNILVEGKSIGEVVTVYDFQGHLMLRSHESVLNISNFSKGIYLVKISGNTTKIIKD